MADALTPPPAPEKPRHCDRIEPIVWLLFGAVVFFTLLLVCISKWSPEDGQTFQFVSTVAGGFLGALMMRVRIDGKADPKVGPQ